MSGSTSSIVPRRSSQGSMPPTASPAATTAAAPTPRAPQARRQRSGHEERQIERLAGGQETQQAAHHQPARRNRENPAASRRLEDLRQVLERRLLGAEGEREGDHRGAQHHHRGGCPEDPDPDHRPEDPGRSEEHTSELQSLAYLVCRLLLEKKKKKTNTK